MLEKSIKYYKDYQKKLSDKYVIKLKNKILKKDNIIDKLQETINMLNKDCDIQMKIQKKDCEIQKKNHKEQMKKSDKILKK